MASKIPHSTATISAHPILCCESLFYPGNSFQESHSCLSTTPIPKEVDASTQKLVLHGDGGDLIDDPQDGFDKISSHHEMSCMDDAFGVC
jgi:hypothetical protein